MNADAVVRARIPSEMKDRATAALNAMGLSVSDAIRLMLRRVADEQKIPFSIEVPNAETRAAIDELDAGKGTFVSSVDELWAEVDKD
ncbi:type II toxin-antitoxin system RelB/DinJ family antitoxin [Gimibacter soli]|uniref:Type II toxin-antitoxin system RelB/DinJ family antitoxin n=1 Tax=Gimibacter soli TaxID=3024400 RepID=A0AAF0BLS9_9PROT|nr:type II toxin-antitoxin system RelB/DinJ family antitoxin [Gimibacter soli]WCL53491.1 type II toxin-antitoxin system RelB/DinJ family antitoxin [Gimibacter soli]